MTTGPNTPPQPTAKSLDHPAQKAQLPTLLKLPGVIAISLYMILLAGVTVAYVVEHHTAILYLVFPVLFIAGALGLLMLLRWAWALTLATIALSSATFLYQYSTGHSFSALMQGLLNLVFFLYLVRMDVREKLR
jgi:hypothetical protein